MKTEELIKELEQMEETWNDVARAEKLGGNVVKEALYKGTAVGIRMAINEITQRQSEAAE